MNIEDENTFSIALKHKESETVRWTQPEVTRYLTSEKARVITNIQQPSLLAFLADKTINTGIAVIIAPGGGFYGLSIETEGIQLAKRLVKRGINAFVLKYRLVPTETTSPFQAFFSDFKRLGFTGLNQMIAPSIALATEDAEAAITHVREHANAYHICPHQIGMIGFSAGAALALAQINSAHRADFIATIYPYSTLPASPKYPVPLFIVISKNDGLGLYPFAMQLYQMWLAEGIPVKLKQYEQGGHGFGLRKQGLPSDQWILAFDAWLDDTCGLL